MLRSFPVPDQFMTLLLLDIGNTRLKWGLWGGGRTDQGAALLAHGAMPQQAIEGLGDALRSHPPTQAAIGCAVAGAVATARVEAQLASLGLGLRCDWVHSPPQQCGVRNGYTNPGLLGADRWAALMGARARHSAEPVLVVSMGTAVTIDCLAADGRFLGGVILPGFGLMLKALEMGTAGLNVPEGELREFPNNTSDALMTGGALAISGAARQMHERLSRLEGRAPVVLLTGGAAPKLELALGLAHQTVDHLVFEGLLCIARQRGLLQPDLALRA
jgi:type III pantothenate kinase